MYRAYYHDTATGHYYLPARYYDPDTMRFLSPDPAPPSAGDPLSLNRYAYCVGGPVDMSDPTGEIADIWREHPGGVTVGMKVMTSVAAAKRPGATGWDASCLKHHHRVMAQVIANPGSVRPSYTMTTTGWKKPEGYDSWQTEWLRARGEWDAVDDYERDGVFEVARTQATLAGTFLGGAAVVAVAVFAAPVSLPVAAIATAGALTYIGMGAADWARASRGYCSGAQVVLDFSQAALFVVPGGAGVNGVGTALGTLGAGVMYLPLDAVVD